MAMTWTPGDAGDAGPAQAVLRCQRQPGEGNNRTTLLPIPEHAITNKGNSNQQVRHLDGEMIISAHPELVEGLRPVHGATRRGASRSAPTLTAAAPSSGRRPCFSFPDFPCSRPGRFPQARPRTGWRRQPSTLGITSSTKVSIESSNCCRLPHPLKFIWNWSRPASWR